MRQACFDAITDMERFSRAPKTPPDVRTPESPAFEQGQADRQRWEVWFGGLSGDYHAGAGYWAAHRSDRPPPTCGNSPPSTSADWTAGCYAGQKRLAGSDLRRKTEPDYRRGWNTLPPASLSSKSKPVEAASSSRARANPASVPSANPELLAFGQKAGMEVTVVSKQGLGTDHALIRGVLTAANSKNYCVGYELDNSQSCVDRFLRETHLSESIKANCGTGIFTTFYGEHLQFIGKNSNPEIMADYAIRNEENGQILDGSAASGLDYDLEQFSALCPGAVAASRSVETVEEGGRDEYKRITEAVSGNLKDASLSSWDSASHTASVVAVWTILGLFPQTELSAEMGNVLKLSLALHKAIPEIRTIKIAVKSPLRPKKDEFGNVVEDNRLGLVVALTVPTATLDRFPADFNWDIYGVYAADRFVVPGTLDGGFIRDWRGAYDDEREMGGFP